MQSTKALTPSQAQQAKARFISNPSQSFSELLPGSWFEQFHAQAGHYRDRVYTPTVTLQAFVEQVLSRDGSCRRAVAQVLADRLARSQSATTLNTGPYCKARQRLPLSLLEQAVGLSGEALEEQLPEAWRWYGYRVKIVDGTTLQMADTASNQSAFPQHPSQGPGLGFPMLRLLGVVSLASGAVLDYAYGRYQGKGSGETTLLSQCLSGFVAGDLLLADSYYCAWAVLVSAHQRGVPALVEHNAGRLAFGWSDGKRLGHQDRLIEWTKPAHKPVWMTSEEFARLPAALSVRVFARKGKVFLTTLTDAKRFSKAALAQLYRQRWSVELDLRTLKTDIGIEQLRCRSAHMVKKELAVTLLAYNMIRALIAQAAVTQQRLPRQLSFRAAVQLIEAFRPLIANACSAIYQILHRAIASATVGNRKRPAQPRALKRRPKNYPKLNVPRRLACKQLANSCA